MSSSTASDLDALVGLVSAKRLALRLAQSRESVHAVLFYGIPGSGKQAVARLLAKAWLCTSAGKEGACGECKACLATDRGNNADLYVIEPTGKSGMIVNEQIAPPDKPSEHLALLTFVRTLPLYSAHKVALIQDAHRMNPAASNALLKTLEEPHPHARLILTTDSIGGVAATILSRCLAVACELPTPDVARDFAPGVSEDILRMTNGAPGRLARAAAHPESFQRLAQFARSLRTLAPGAALVASDNFRSIAEALGAEAGMTTARASNTYALELLATYLAREPGFPPFWVQGTVEAHRQIVGNGAPGAVMDALFASMLSVNPA